MREVDAHFYEELAESWARLAKRRHQARNRRSCAGALWDTKGSENMGRLTGKIAVITGGNSGIGLATARRFVSEGAYVFISGRRQDELNKALAILGSGVTGVQGDISHLDDIERLFATVQAEKGHVDVLFANAGIGGRSPLGSISEEQFDKVFDVNVKGTLFTVQTALPLMQSGGSIILTGSTTGSMGTPAFSV
jgi:NAD(P)-dependent dehydrogenase (short-subunit alcohol dehydrogenase family)